MKGQAAVLGDDGFLGSMLVAGLASHGWRVTELDRYQAGVQVWDDSYIDVCTGT